MHQLRAHERSTNTAETPPKERRPTANPELVTSTDT